MAMLIYGQLNYFIYFAWKVKRVSLKNIMNGFTKIIYRIANLLSNIMIDYFCRCQNLVRNIKIIFDDCLGYVILAGRHAIYRPTGSY